MCEVVTCTPRSSRSSGARRSVMTSHRRPRRAAATLNLTGALSRATLVPDRRRPVSVPSATTPLAVALKVVIFALIEREDDVAASAVAGTANATVAASAANMAGWGFMPGALPLRQASRAFWHDLGAYAERYAASRREAQATARASRAFTKPSLPST